MVGLGEEVDQVGLIDAIAGALERDQIASQSRRVAGHIGDARRVHIRKKRAARSPNPPRGGSTTTRSGMDQMGEECSFSDCALLDCATLCTSPARPLSPSLARYCSVAA